MRPSLPPATTTSLTAVRVSPPTETSSVDSSTVRYSPASTRETSSSCRSAGIAVRKPTRPKLTPTTGTPVPRKRPSARSIVPSPPSTIAMSTSADSSTSSTPRSAATCSSLASASPTPARSIVTTAARSTDGIGDPPVEVGRELRLLSLDEVEDELMVSLRAGETRVYDPPRLRPRREQRLGDGMDDATAHLGIAHDALRRVRASGLELRLHQHERLPAGSGERKRRWKHERDRDERDVARDELRCERQLRERSCIHALEHGHAFVVADLRVELPVADVERDHAPGSTLQQHVGEASCRGAEVERVEPAHVDAEGVERVRELVPGAGDVRRRRLDLERGTLVDLLPRLRVSGHATGHDERLGLRARLREPALDEQDVKPLLRAHLTMMFVD